MKHPFLLAALLGLGLAACDGSTDISRTCSDNSTATACGTSSGSSDRFKVVDTVVGTWVSQSGAWKGDTVRITKDSLDWMHGLGLYPTKLGVKFYAYGGNMGLTTGLGTDNVTFEYLKSGDTLWLEMQNLADRPYDGRVDRSLLSTFALLPVR